MYTYIYINIKCYLRYSEAEQLCREVLDLSRRVLGEEHPDTISCINNLANCVKNMGRYGFWNKLNCGTS